MFSQDQSRSISATSEFSYDNFDGFEISDGPIQAEVDVDRLYKIVNRLSKFDKF